MREDGKSGLAEREAAVVSGNDAVGEDFEGLGAEEFDGAAEQSEVLEYSAGEADPVQAGVFTSLAADVHNPLRDGFVKGGGDLFTRHSGSQVFYDGL